PEHRVARHRPQAPRDALREHGHGAVQDDDRRRVAPRKNDRAPGAVGLQGLGRLLSGGGGNRTRVPKPLGVSFYARSPTFGSRPLVSDRAGSSGTSLGGSRPDAP